MSISLSLRYLAPIPIGHRVQVVYAQYWSTPLFGGEPHWENAAQPILLDLETGIVYCGPEMQPRLVPSPLGFLPNSGHQVSRIMEGRVVSCMVASDGGDTSSIHTALAVEPTPQGYRG